MESPDRNSQNSAGDIQGSPLFNFLCSLSPIKSVKSTRVAQTYSEISFPPPPAVFVSPGVNAQKVSRSLQRHQSARRINEAETPSDISPSTGCKAVKHVLVGPTQRFQGYQSTRKVPKTDSITSPCSSPSKLVEEYLADPIEDEPNTDVEKGELDLGTSKCHVRDSGCGLSYEHMDVVQLSKQEEVVFAEKSCTQDVQASHVFDDISLSPCIPDQNEDAGGTSLDCHNQEAGELEFLMPEDMDESGQDPCLDGWRTRTPSSLADLSAEQVEGYIASLRGIASKGDELEVLTSHLEITGVADSSLPIDSLDNDPGPKGSQGIGACKAIGPHQRGVRRRCLDFEVSEDLLQIKDGIVSLKSVHRNLDKQQDLSSCEAEEDRALLVLQRRLSATIGATNSNAVQRVSRRSPLVDIDSRHSGAKVSPSGMPSGIGLHLNSLTSSMAFAQIRDNDLNTESLASLRPGTISSKLQGGAVESTQKCLLPLNPGKRMYAQASAESKQGLSGAHLETRLDNFEVQSECSDQDMEFSKSGVCARAGSFANKQQVLDIAPLNGLNKGLNFLGRKRGFLQDTAHLEAEGAEDSIESPQSPKKKRRSSSAADKSGDGCKRCNCKKSRCLKLYCECFAAGVYCVDSCTCQGCFNKPEFQETVMDTRQQIESRNPLAFAPKIVRTVEASPSKKDEARDTPASARHKRGCNCKKSHCLKKYCECFQAGVGCSDGCRCDNCKNVHGRKEGAQEFDDNDLPMETAVGKEHMDEPGTGSEYRAELLHGSQQNNLELSPTTPGFQYGGQHRPATRTSSLVKKRGSLEGFPSPSFSFSSVKACRSPPLRPPRSPSRLLRSCKGNQTSPPMASTGASVSKSASSPSTTPRIMRIGRFSPRWDGLDEICTLTPVLQAPLRPTPAASASVLDGAEMSPSIDDQNCNELSSNGTCAIRQSSKFASLTSSLSHQQSSRCPTPADTQDTPQTRMPCSAACSTDNKPLHENSQPYAVQFLDNDNTPAFLKDPEPECLPVCLLNSSSPKHKRVSPPHHHAVREASHRSLQSAGLRSSRKFILQSIPSVPPISFPSAHEKPIVGNSSHTTDLEA